MSPLLLVGVAQLGLRERKKWKIVTQLEEQKSCKNSNDACLAAIEDDGDRLIDSNEKKTRTTNKVVFISGGVTFCLLEIQVGLLSSLVNS
jgi:hypothetical protein